VILQAPSSSGDALLDKIDSIERDDLHTLRLRRSG
jgi:hypothetical protein